MSSPRDLLEFDTEEFIEIDSNTSYRSLGNCPDFHNTPFATKIELSADYQDSKVIIVSDELYGSSKNLIKTTADNIKQASRDNEEDGEQSGWLVRRHETKGFVTIELGVPGIVFGVDVDITGYIQCAPVTVSIQGHLNSYPGKWSTILPETLVNPGSHNFFEIRNKEVFTHINLISSPGGGINRLRVFGDVIPPDMPMDTIFDLTSTKLGCHIVQKPLNILRNDVPNILLSRSNSSSDGWICPRDKNSPSQPQYTTIKLATEGIIDRVIVDTKHFIGNAPKSIIVQGCSILDQAVNQNQMDNLHWVDLIVKNEEKEQLDYDIYPNMVHVMPCVYPGPITHIRIQPIPGD
ncbi:hypothetical protein INT47_008534 [Mucor saturninus]|uniref:Allantoicase domain-containing protein n=1 Tax=Mucor saturninus TaxID=64648 RepID=A0A8H7RA22_9FUNG|nr:hypothetical protein INT47_008534 [Mucor saturninus]